MGKVRPKFFAGRIYHIFNKSIAGFKIFRDFGNSERFVRTLDHYNNKKISQSLSGFLAGFEVKPELPQLLIPKENALVKFLSHSVMPDHYHLILKALEDHIVSKYINDVENSFTRFFNVKFKRKGPMWQHAFKSVIVKSNEQLLHLTRYVNLNATTSNLVENPEDWIFSSYRDLIDEGQNILKNHLPEISIASAKAYKKFVENNKDYQRKLKLIKKLILE